MQGGREANDGETQSTSHCLRPLCPISTRHAGDHEDVMVRERPIHRPRPAVRTRTSPQSILCPSPAPDSPSTAS